MAPRTLHSVLFLFVLMVYTLPINAETSDDARNLYTKLITTNAYNKHVRPILDQTQAITVTVDYYLTGIIDFDEQNEKLTTSGYLAIYWEDYYLKWNLSDYNNLDFLFIPQDDVWKPDVALKNSGSEFKGLGSSFLYVKIDQDGNVQWIPYMILQSICSVDITYIPFDIQMCSLKFVAWSYTKNEVLLTEGSGGINLDNYEENSEWTMVSSSVDTLNAAEDAIVVFQFTLKRKPLFYVLNIIVPVIMLSVLNACIFVLPAESGEKASFSVTAFLSLAVFLSIVASTLPQNSDKVSYLGIYLIIMAGISTLIVVMTLFELRLYFRDATVDPIPKWLIRLQATVEVIRCSRRYKVNPSAHDQNEESKENRVGSNGPLRAWNKQSEVTWKSVVNALDFVLFWIFLLIICTTTGTLYILSSTGAS